MDIESLWSILGCNIISLPFFFAWKYKNYKTKKKQSRSINYKREVIYFVLFEYFVCLVAVTVIPLPHLKEYAGYLNLDPFNETYRNFISAYNHTSIRNIWTELINILGNIILFLPFGLLLPILYKFFRNFIVLFILAAVASFCIEAIQYFITIKWHFGRVSDIDDIMLNTFGACIGYLSYLLFSKPLKRFVS